MSETFIQDIKSFAKSAFADAFYMNNLRQIMDLYQLSEVEQIRVEVDFYMDGCEITTSFIKDYDDYSGYFGISKDFFKVEEDKTNEWLFKTRGAIVDISAEVFNEAVNQLRTIGIPCDIVDTEVTDCDESHSTGMECRIKTKPIRKGA